MGPNRRKLAACASACSLFVLAGSMTGLAGCGGDDGAGDGAPSGGAPGNTDGDGANPAPVPTPPEPAPAPIPEITGVRVWFKLDARLTTGSYLGERWVSPGVFQAATQTGPVFTVEARAEGTRGGTASWTPSDPDMVVPSPAQGHQVVLTVQRDGRSTLTVSDGDTSAVLTVVAVHDNGVWRVQISR